MNSVPPGIRSAPVRPTWVSPLAASQKAIWKDRWVPNCPVFFFAGIALNHSHLNLTVGELGEADLLSGTSGGRSQLPEIGCVFNLID